MKSFFKKYYDWKLSILLLVFYFVTVGLNLLRISAMAHFDNQAVLIGKDIIVQLLIVDIVLVMLIMHIVAMHTKRLILRRIPWRFILLFHFTIAIFIGVIIQGVTDFYRLRWGLISNLDLSKSVKSFLSLIDINFLVYFAMIFIIYTYYYFNLIRANEIKQSKLEAELITAQLNTLKAQMEPHFLFNTLNSIVGLIDIDSRKAQNVLVDLSQLLRTITKTTHILEHTLAEELDLVHPYLEILQIRFDEDIEIQFDIDEDILNETVPTLMFQPLIENAINHGFSHTSGVFKIFVSGKKTDQYLVFKVENNGKLLSKNAQSGVGVSNLKQRLHNLYGTAAKFSLENKANGQGVENKIILPIK